ncbi:MAG TPA: phosphoribosyl-ATP diphosphatase [Spirochaetota bacterium]
MSAVFKDLFAVIEDRKSKDPSESYVSSLMHKGTAKINEKITEEAQELCEAACEDDHNHLVYEMCDLLFHTFVLAGHKGVTLDELENELSRRFGTSGHAEKASRNKK